MHSQSLNAASRVTQERTGRSALPDIVISGTAGGAWGNLAAALSQRLSAAGATARVQQVPELERLAAEDPGRCFVALVAGPDLVLASQAPDAQDPVAALDAWARSARQLLRLARQRPGRWRLLDLREASLAPEALAGELTSWGLSLPVGALAGLPGLDTEPLALLLAARLAEQQPGIQRLQQELLASCVPLLDDTAAAEPDWQALAAGHRALVLQARQDAAALAALRSTLATAQGEQAQMLEQLHLAQEGLARLHDEREAALQRAQQLAADLSTATRQADALRKQHTALQADLQQAKDSQASFAQDLQARQAVIDQQAAERHALESAIEHERAAALAERSTAATERAAAAALQGQLQGERDAAQATLAAQHARLAAAARDNMELLEHVHLLQEQLEARYLELEARDAEAAMLHHHGGVAASARQAVVVASRNEPPHCHADIALDDLRIGERQWPTLRVRLVEHDTHPGLLFWSEEGRQPLSAWATNGDEDGRAFLLLVPDSPDGRQRLLSLGSRDWQCVVGVAGVLQRCLADAGDGAARWAGVAARLCRQLAHLPARLRYDEASVAGEGDSVDVVFRGASHGSIALGALRLRWWPQQQRIDWRAPDDPQQVPLATWPVDAGGRLQPGLTLPVGPAFGSAQRRRLWAALPAADRALVLAVLDALPGAARQTDAAAWPAGTSPQGLSAQGAALHKQARRTLASLRLRDLGRRLLGRAQAH